MTPDELHPVSGDRRARFVVVFREHFDVVLRFAASRADREAAKDATAETFLAAWLSLDELPTDPRAWLLTGPVARSSTTIARPAVATR